VRACAAKLAACRRERYQMHDTAGSRRCECGRPKTKTAMYCAECVRLDGRRAEAELVFAMRVLGGVATLDALLEELGPTWSRNRCQQLAGHLRRRGRLVRREVGEATRVDNELVWVLVEPRAKRLQGCGGA
jgi:hypothetical protein